MEKAPPRWHSPLRGRVSCGPHRSLFPAARQQVPLHPLHPRHQYSHHPQCPERGQRPGPALRLDRPDGVAREGRRRGDEADLQAACRPMHQCTNAPMQTNAPMHRLRLHLPPHGAPVRGLRQEVQGGVRHLPGINYKAVKSETCPCLQTILFIRDNKG